MNAGFLSPNTTHALARQPRPPCVLIIDVNLTELQATSRTIEMCGYKTVQRFEHSVALRTFQRTPDCYDVVVIDFSKSIRSARHLAREIRRLNPDIGLIFYVDSAKSTSREELRQLDALCVVKPAPMLQFAGTLMTLLGQLQCPASRPMTSRPAEESVNAEPMANAYLDD